MRLRVKSIFRLFHRHDCYWKLQYICVIFLTYLLHAWCKRIFEVSTQVLQAIGEIDCEMTEKSSALQDPLPAQSSWHFIKYSFLGGKILSLETSGNGFLQRFLSPGEGSCSGNMAYFCLSGYTMASTLQAIIFKPHESWGLEVVSWIIPAPSGCASCSHCVSMFMHEAFIFPDINRCSDVLREYVVRCLIIVLPEVQKWWRLDVFSGFLVEFQVTKVVV